MDTAHSKNVPTLFYFDIVQTLYALQCFGGLYMMSSIIDKIRMGATAQSHTVVLPEAADERILRAAVKVRSAGIAWPVLLGDPKDIETHADELGLSLKGIVQYHPEDLAQSSSLQACLRSRKPFSDLSEADLVSALKDPLTLGCCLLATGEVDACVAGAINTTKRVIQQGLRIIGTSEESPLLSSFFLMIFDRAPVENLDFALFADCAINVNPDSDQLAQIALATAKSAQALFQLDPRLALLSFSTAGSAAHPDADKVVKAVERLRVMCPEIKLIGEAQFDAALVPAVRDLKMPASDFSGPANIYIFPDLDAGNIAAKIAERIGGCKPIGPVLQGLRKPLNDLSRGADVDSIVNTIAMTCLQVGGNLD